MRKENNSLSKLFISHIVVNNDAGVWWMFKIYILELSLKPVNHFLAIYKMKKKEKNYLDCQYNYCRQNIEDNVRLIVKF